MFADRDLVQRCLRGDSVATRELVTRFESDVFGLCVRLLRHRQDAEDVAQEVFARVFRSLARWDASRPLRPWVLGITVNRCRTAMAKRAKQPEPVDYLGDHHDPTPPPCDRELLDAIGGCVSDLRDEYREVFVLFHESGRSYDEIAAAVDRPVGTVKTWLHRARRMVLDGLNRRGFLIGEPEQVSSTN